MEYVIIGNGTAAIACIEGIREYDSQNGITLISSESRHCYGRPLISYKLLGKITEENMDYRPRDFYKKNNVTPLLGVTAERIDPQTKTVYLSGGKTVNYNKLLVATGSTPFIPPMDGLEKVKNRFTFSSYDDMKKLEKALSKDKRVLIIGAGLIGLKCAEGVLHRVKSIAVVDMADRILPSVLDSDGAAIIQRQLQKLNIEFYLSDSAAHFEENAAVLKSGKRLEFDILVTAVGVRPSVSLVKDAGGNVNRGIEINYKCETTLHDVFAAGDCTEGYDMAADAKRVLAILPNAYMQGRCAGINMAGGLESYTTAIPENAIGFFGSHVLTAGSYEGEMIVNEVKENSMRRLFAKDGKLCGFILINDFARAGIYTSLIKNQTPLSEVDITLLKSQPALMAFSKEDRRKKLARKV